MTEAPPEDRPEAALFAQVAGHRFALDSRYTLGVRGVPHVTRLPHQPSHLLGVFQHEGRIVPLLDLVHLSGGRGSARDPRIVVLASGELVLGVLFTSVEDVLPLDAARIAAVEPGHLPKPLRPLVQGHLIVEKQDPTNRPQREQSRDTPHDPRIQALLEQAPDWFVRIQDPDDAQRRSAAKKRLKALCNAPGGVDLLSFARLWGAARAGTFVTPTSMEAES